MNIRHFVFSMIVLLPSVPSAVRADELSEVNAVLDALYTTAAQGELEAYRGLYHEDAIFFGTDVSERWTLEQLIDYAREPFSDGEGWAYEPIARHVEFPTEASMALFDEVLRHESYGTARGTGALISTSEGWKIIQYNLHFPVPNAVATEVINIIRTAPAEPAQ